MVAIGARTNRVLGLAVSGVSASGQRGGRMGWVDALEPRRLLSGVSFAATPLDYGTGNGPVSVAAADFNGDGRLDLATANSLDGTVSVLLDNSDATLVAKVDYAVGASPMSIASGDFNGDDKADLAVANEGGKTVSVLMNRGDGTFAGKVAYVTGSSPESVVCADFDGDGWTDLAAACDGKTSVLLNRRDGTFATKVDYVTGSYTSGRNAGQLIAGDFNNDGKQDLAALGMVNGVSSIGVLLNVTNFVPVVSVSSPVGNQAGDVTIGYTLRDAESEPCSLQVQYSADGGLTWNPATANGGDGTTNVPSSPTGIAHTFVWASGSDLANADRASVKIRLTPADSAAGPAATTASFAVKNHVNQAPTDVSLANSSVAENQPAGTLVGDLTPADPDAGDTFTYALVTGTGSTDNASFSISGGQLKTAAIFNFETRSSYSIRVRATDGGGLSVEKALTISVTNVDELPTNLALSATSISENQPVGAVVGNLTTTDPDTADTFTYTLVTGTGSGGNGMFTISGSQLKTNASIDYETKTYYSVRVRTTDQGGLWYEKSFTVNVVDVTEPLVINGTGANDTIALTTSGSNLVVTVNGVGKSYSLATQSSITVNGLAGDDTVTFAGGVPSVTVFAGDGNDSIYAGSGNDYIDCGAGNDLVGAGPGRDTIIGAAGDDQLHGGKDNDSVDGGLGNDSLWGDMADDVIRGGDGNDVVSRGNGNDTIWGDAGDDDLRAGQGNDLVYGGTGRDTLWGDGGNNTLDGGDDNDVIYARNALADTVIGGAGSDQAQIDTLLDVKPSADVETLLA